MRFSHLTWLAAVTLAGALWLGGCSPSTAGCNANCDAQEAAGCDDGLPPDLCRMVCDALDDALDGDCVRAVDDLFACLAAEGYMCSDEGSSGSPVPSQGGTTCLSEAQAAQPCMQQVPQ